MLIDTFPAAIQRHSTSYDLPTMLRMPTDPTAQLCIIIRCNSSWRFGIDRLCARLNLTEYVEATEKVMPLFKTASAQTPNLWH